MLRRTLASLVLLSAASAAQTASGFRLGLDYSEWGVFDAGRLATDGSGALYVMYGCTPFNAIPSPDCVTKLSADGKSVLWQASLGFTTAGMAVDPNGGVYAAPAPSVDGGAYNAIVEKLSADGQSVMWQTQVATGAGEYPSGIVFAVDSTGRVFVAGSGTVIGGTITGNYFVRLNAAGAIDYATVLDIPGTPTAIAVDPTGSDVVIELRATSTSTPQYARLAPDGAAEVSFALPLAWGAAIAVAANGDAVVYGSDFNRNWSLQRISRTGAVVFSETISEVNEQPAVLALDAAGNAYIIGYSGAFLHPVKSTLAPCGSTWLSVYAPDGTLLQTTYLPGATYGSIATSGDSVFVSAIAGSFVPTQTGPFPQYPYGMLRGSAALYRLSPNANAQTVPLACVGNAATFGTGPVAPGEIVTLFGNGLGPQQGIQLTAALQSPFPTQAGSVQVTFDGKPAPLLWVQDAQINLVVPWSVTGPTTKICATYNSAQTNCLTWPVAQAAPGVFTVDGVHAAALNQDGTVNSATNPAPPDSIVSFFATGLGPINPTQADGSLVGLPLPINTLPLILQAIDSVCVGEGIVLPIFCPSTPYSPAYAGPAPFLIAGASQVNFNASDAFFGGVYLVQATTGTGSNTFQIYVANQ